MRNLIFVSLEDWDEIWRRNQFVCAELARRHAELRILFVGLPRNVSYELRHGRVAGLMRRGTYRVSGFDNVVVTHPWKLLPDSVAVGRRINQWMFRCHVLRVAKRLGIGRAKEALLWLNPHSAVHMVGKMGEEAVVYDVTDDWIAMTQSPTLALRTEAQDAELCKRSDAVIVCSDRLMEMKTKLAGKRLHLVPNGVDAAHYADVMKRVLGDGGLPETARHWPRPVLGYTGTVHPDRVDVDLVEKVARQWSGSIVLLGPNHLSSADRTRLAKLSNVVLHGPVAYAEVPRYMRRFDVCIVPHRMTAFTESLNPIKLWEYLAAGKPIVSTDVAGFRDFPKLVRLARTADEFEAAADAALEEATTPKGNSLASERQAVAREHSWVRRVDEIERVIEEAIERRRLADGDAMARGRKAKSPVGSGLAADR